MTDGNPRPDENPANADDGLAPPFVPGATTPPTGAGPAPAAPTEDAGLETGATVQEETAGPSGDTARVEDEDAFPFEDDRDSDGTAGEPEPAEVEPGTGASDTGPAAAEMPLDALEAAPDPESGDEFPFEAFDIEGESEAGDEVEHEEEVEVEHEVEAEAELEAEAPFGAEEEPAEEAVVQAPVSTKGRAAAELADRLEAMAHRLREQGATAAEAEMSSQDRFTALLAGLLAGYLAARE